MDSNPKTHTCDCGFTWEHGKSGSHICGPYYREKIAKLESALSSLQAPAVQEPVARSISDKEAWEIYSRAQQSVGEKKGVAFAMAITKAIIAEASALSTDAQKVREQALSDRDVMDVIAIAQYLRTVQHWEAQAGATRLAEILKKIQSQSLPSAEKDADRWRYARQFLSIAAIEEFQRMAAAGHIPEEEHSKRADEAMDAAIAQKENGNEV